MGQPQHHVLSNAPPSVRLIAASFAARAGRDLNGIQAHGGTAGDLLQHRSDGRDQFEAASALGLPFPVALWKIVIPQAVRIATPAQTSNCVAIAKDTSLASVVAMPDLLKQATDAQALMANPSPLISAALIYLVLLWPLVRLVSHLESRAQARSR